MRVSLNVGDIVRHGHSPENLIVTRVTNASINTLREDGTTDTWARTANLSVVGNMNLKGTLDLLFSNMQSVGYDTNDNPGLPIPDVVQLQEYVHSKCFEVKMLRYSYNNAKKEVQKYASELDSEESSFWLSGIGHKVEELNKAYDRWSQCYTDISQLCHKLGGWYLEEFEHIVEEK